jgi:hypothetical protein
MVQHCQRAQEATHLFAQIFAGSPREREGWLGWLLRAMAWTTLAQNWTAWYCRASPSLAPEFQEQLRATGLIALASILPSHQG